MKDSPKFFPPPIPAPFGEPWSAKKLLRMLAVFGPAAVVASVAIGAGETIVVVRAGAFTGYGLLWLILLSVLAKGVFGTYLLGRYTAVSGEPLGQRVVRLPGPRGWLLVLMVGLELAAAAPLWAALCRPSGELLGYLMLEDPSASPGATKLLATGFLVLALSLSLKSNYRLLELQQLVICGVLVLGTIVGTLLVKPDWGAAFAGLLSFGNFPEVIPSAPEDFRRNTAAILAVTFGYVGGSVMTYLVYPEWVALHGWGMTGHPQIEQLRQRAAEGTPGDYLPDAPDDVAVVRRSVAPLRWDVACGAAVLLVVTASFLIAGAAVLHPRLASGELTGAFAGWSLLTDQASIWRNIHPSLAWVYYVCVLFALWGTLQAYPEIYARGVVDYARAIWPGCVWSQSAVQRWCCLYVFGGATVVLWSGADFNLLTLVVAFLATNLGVAIAIVTGLWLNFQLPAAYRTSGWVLVGGVCSAAAMWFVSAVSGWGVFPRLTEAM